MTFTDRITAPVRRVFSGRPAAASLELAEGKAGPDTKVIGAGSVGYASGNGTVRLAELETRYELRGPQGGTTYRRMRKLDPHIYHLRRAQNLPIVGASPSIDPADPDDADAVAKADLVRRAILDGSVWPGFIRDAQLSLDYGFSAFEICWYRDKRTGEVRTRLELRPASSIPAGDVYVRNGSIDHIVQHPLEGGERPIPGDKLVWIAYDKEGDGFTGSPILRPMYQPWRIKVDLIVHLPIQIHKGAGVPVIGTDYTKDDTEEWAALTAMGENFGQGVNSYAMFDKDRVNLELMATNTTVKDTLDAIEQQNRELTKTCQAQVFDLGVNKAGSFALGKTLSDAFNSGVQSQADYIASVLNADGGLIHQLVDFNFASDDNRPTLRIGNVETVDMKSFAQALLWISQAIGGIPDDVAEWALEQMNMPTGDITSVDMKPKPQLQTTPEPPVPASSKSSGPGADAAGGSGPESGAKAAESCEHCSPGSTGRGELPGLQLTEGRKLRREPIGVEAFVALAEVDQRFTDAKTAVRVATQATRDKLNAELIRRATDAQAAGKLAQFSAGAAPMVDKLAAEVRRVLDDFYEAGRQQVEDELDRQKRGEPVVEDVVEARREGEPVIAAAEKPRPKKAKLPDPDVALDVQAEAVARGMADAGKSAAAAAAARVAAGTPLTPAGFAAAVSRASDDAALRLGLTVSDAMILGRSVVAGERVLEIEQAVYSAILDERTCSACEPMDGEMTTDMGEAAGWCPNPDCEGGLYCRCIQVYELKQEATS